MRLRSTGGERDFEVFMRINESFQENFSIGLEYLPRDERGSFCVLRYNGPHGEFAGNLASSHFLYHIHRAKTENIEAGLKAERGGDATEAYASYTQALRHFLKEINVLNVEEFFPGLNQFPFDFGRPEQEP